MERGALPYTATMARVYAEEGYLRKAAAIYRELLDANPSRKDCSAALAELEKQIAQQRAPSRKDLEQLMREWRDLIRYSTEMSRKLDD